MAVAKLDTRTALAVEPNTNDLVFIHRPSGLSYKMTWEVFKGLIEGFIAEGQYLDFGGVNQVSAAELKPIVDGDIEFVDTVDSMTVTNQATTVAGQNIPRAGAEVVSGGVTYDVSVRDTTLIGGSFQAVLAAVDLSTFTGSNVVADASKVEMKHIVLGVATALISVEDGLVKINTANQIAGSVVTGDTLEYDTTTGSVEYAPKTWATIGRPATPYSGQDGFNTTLSQREYWDGAAWVQY